MGPGHLQQGAAGCSDGRLHSGEGASHIGAPRLSCGAGTHTSSVSAHALPVIGQSSRPGNRFGEISIAFAACAPLPMQNRMSCSACEVVQSRRGEGTPGLAAAIVNLHMCA